MSTSRFFNVIALSGMGVAIVLTVLLNIFTVNLKDTVASSMVYEEKIFDTSIVHTIDIRMEDWESFLDTAVKEEYSSCNLIINGEVYQNVGIRAKGNTSLAGVEAMGNRRYSLKVEFDHYEEGMSYYGLDKLCLNNLYADNTYMKDYLCYKMMQDMGVPSPLCSYVYLTVNGEDWGLYLATEGVEESFLERNYGNDYGKLYKPETDKAAKEYKSPAQAGAGEAGEDVKLKYVDDRESSYRNIFNYAKTEITGQDRQRLIQALFFLSVRNNPEEAVDIEAVIKYFVVHNFVCNEDGYTGVMAHNYYLYEDMGRLSMIPWDYNLAFGGFMQMDNGKEGDVCRATAEVNAPIDSPVLEADISDRPMVAWIVEKEEYREIYHNYYTLLVKENFSDASLEKEIIRVEEMIAPYVKKDATAFCTVEEFEIAVDTLKSFLNLRAESVVGQLNGTIPSTKEGQKKDSGALIQAENLELKLMGEMSMGSAPSVVK